MSVDLREFAYVVTRDQGWRQRVENYLAATLPAAAASSVSVYAAILSMLWPRESEVRRTSLQSYNPYRNARSTDPAAVRELLLRRTVRTVELATGDWQEALRAAFAEHGACRLSATVEQSRELRTALVMLGATPVDVGVLQFFPAIERIERGEGRIIVDLLLREHA